MPVARTTTRFVFRPRPPDAEQVFLMGTFNDWSTVATPMRPAAGGRWVAAVDLGPGEHRFSYFVVRPERRAGGGLPFGVYVTPEARVCVGPRTGREEGEDRTPAPACRRRAEASWQSVR